MDHLAPASSEKPGPEEPGAGGPERYDIFVIGGGIARDATGRGHRVALADMDDLGSGTSVPTFMRRWSMPADPSSTDDPYAARLGPRRLPRSRVARSIGRRERLRLGDQGSEFISRDLDLWAHQKDVLDFSRPGKPTDNAFIESFSGKFRAECLNTHGFMSLDDARAKMEAWRETPTKSALTARSATRPRSS